MDNDNPPERDVGARIRVKEEYADLAAAAFKREGLHPLFGEMADADLLRACEAIPREWYALSANIR